MQYPKSIAQAVSLAETTELAVKASRRPVGKLGSSGTNPNKGPMNQNRAEVHGEEVVDAVVDFAAIILVDQSVEDQMEDAVIVDVVVGMRILTPWRAISVGCVAIWPVTVLAPGQNR